MKKTTLQIQRLQGADSSLPPVYVTYVAHRKTWILLADYKASVEVAHDEEILLVDALIPLGFEFDLASVPRILWPLLGSFELSIVAPLVHDWLYRYEGRPLGLTSIFGLPLRVDRTQADKAFLDLMLMEGVPAWKAKAAYFAVRWFGPRW